MHTPLHCLLLSHATLTVRHGHCRHLSDHQHLHNHLTVTTNTTITSAIEELGAAILPSGPEAWAAAGHPALAPYPELTPTAAATLHHHTTLLQHPALTQLPVRVSYPPLVLRAQRAVGLSPL